MTLFSSTMEMLGNQDTALLAVILLMVIFVMIALIFTIGGAAIASGTKIATIFLTLVVVAFAAYLLYTKFGISSDIGEFLMNLFGMMKG